MVHEVETNGEERLRPSCGEVETRARKWLRPHHVRRGSSSSTVLLSGPLPPEGPERTREGSPVHRNRAATTPVEDHLWQAFGLRLRQWRRRAGLTQAQLGAEIGYDHTAVSKLE
ncbi:helix-turn-helix transcriptional regulator, partial [Kitasatospora sp. MBT66]|uniref:helix-turn-helix domain-containing protein n=1 Tax=Kitasatospora sp. MBT66 TaxID=1444769 RepID=UPI001A7E1B98